MKLIKGLILSFILFSIIISVIVFADTNFTTNQTAPCGTDNQGNPCICIDQPANHANCDVTPIYSNGCLSSYDISGCTNTTPAYVNEQVKCIFTGSDKAQKCYLAGKNDIGCSTFGCEGNKCTQECTASISGYIGQQLTWKSTCGNYQYTTITGNNKEIKFDCSTTSSCASHICDDGSIAPCKEENGYCTCSTCPPIIVKPVCGNGICESGEGEICMATQVMCGAGKDDCIFPPTTCKIACPQDCKNIQGIDAYMNQKFKLQVNQYAKVIDFPSSPLKVTFRDLLTPKCAIATTNVARVQEKIVDSATTQAGGKGKVASVGVSMSESELSTAKEKIAESTTSSGSIPSWSGGVGVGGGSNTSTSPIEIFKCPEVGPMAQLEIEMPSENGRKIVTLKLNEAKNVYDTSIVFLDYDYASGTGLFVVNSQTSTCPMNCICDENGNTIACHSTRTCPENTLLCPDGTCQATCSSTNFTTCDYGCIYNNKCLPIGVRAKGLFCSIDGSLTNQLSADEKCENNFECSSNVCVNNQCVSSGLIQKVLDWFKKLFGG